MLWRESNPPWLSVEVWERGSQRCQSAGAGVNEARAEGCLPYYERLSGNYRLIRENWFQPIQHGVRLGTCLYGGILWSANAIGLFLLNNINCLSSNMIQKRRRQEQAVNRFQLKKSSIWILRQITSLRRTPQGPRSWIPLAAGLFQLENWRHQKTKKPRRQGQDEQVLPLRISVRRCGSLAAPLMNLLEKIRIPRKHCRPFFYVGQGKAEMISVFLTSGKQPDPETLIQRRPTVGANNMHLSGLILRPWRRRSTRFQHVRYEYQAQGWT